MIFGMICQIDLGVYIALERVHIVEHLVFIPEMEIVLSGEGFVIAEGDVTNDVFPFVGVGHAFLVFNHLVVEVSEVPVFLDEFVLVLGGLGEELTSHLVCQRFIFQVLPFGFGEWSGWNQ